MMPTGGKPKPTALKLVAGNPGKRPLNMDEPTPDVLEDHSPPAMLSSAGRQHWDEVAPKLARYGLLTKLDVDALVLYCECYAQWLEAIAKVRELGTIIKAPKSGLPIQSPYLGIANRAFDKLVRMQSEFGMTPSSRSRVTVKKDDGERNPFSRRGAPPAPPGAKHGA